LLLSDVKFETPYAANLAWLISSNTNEVNHTDTADNELPDGQYSFRRAKVDGIANPSLHHFRNSEWLH
jgi:hypothetical protein